MGKPISAELGNLMLNIGCMLSNGKDLREELHPSEVRMMEDYFGDEWTEKFMKRK